MVIFTHVCHVVARQKLPVMGIDKMGNAIPALATACRSVFHSLLIDKQTWCNVL